MLLQKALGSLSDVLKRAGTRHYSNSLFSNMISISSKFIIPYVMNSNIQNNILLDHIWYLVTHIFLVTQDVY